MSDDVLNETPDIYKDGTIGVLCPLLEFLAVLQEITNEEKVRLDLSQSHFVYIFFLELATLLFHLGLEDLYLSAKWYDQRLNHSL